MNRPAGVRAIVCLLALPLLLGTVTAANARTREDTSKAALIPKFARYVTWPAPVPAQAPWSLCMIGQDPFGAAIDRAAAGESIKGRRFRIRRLTGPQGAERCHLAFVRGASQAETAQWLLALRHVPVLTITDQRAGPQRGIVHFTRADGRVRFFIDDAAAAQKRLSISSRLLALAIGVRQRRP